MPELTEEQKQKRRENLAKARAARGKNRPMPVTKVPEQVAETIVREPVFAPGVADPFDAFVASLDSETRRILNDLELRAIFEAQKKKAAEEKKAITQRRVAEQALHHAKVDAGLLPTTAIVHADWKKRMDEMVTFTVDLPEMGDWGLRVDGKIIHHGETITCTRAQYLSYAEMCWRNRQVELDFEGKGRLSHLRRVSTGALNARI